MDKSEAQSKLAYLQSKFMKVVDSLDPENLHKQIHIKDNGWTTIEILRHIATAEHDIAELMRAIDNGGDGVDDTFDLTRQNEIDRQRDADLGLVEIRKRMEQSRENTLDFFVSTVSDTWIKEGRYFTGDIMTIERMFQILMWHQNHHLKQIIENLDLELD